MPTLRHADPDRCSIVAHVIASVLARGLEDPRAAAALAQRRGAIGLTVSGIETTLQLAGTELVLYPGPPSGDAVALSSDLRTLLAVAGGKSWLGEWMRGRLRVRGNPLRLRPLLRLLRAARRGAAREAVR